MADNKEIVREALDFYAHPAGYDVDGKLLDRTETHFMLTSTDRGQRARKANNALTTLIDPAELVEKLEEAGLTDLRYHGEYRRGLGAAIAIIKELSDEKNV